MSTITQELKKSYENRNPIPNPYFGINSSLYSEMDFEKRTRKRKFQEISIINIQHGIFKFQVKKRERKVFGENGKPKTAMKKYNKSMDWTE